MKKWFRFFVGTPRRFCLTALVLLLIAAAIDPRWLRAAIGNLAIALHPLGGLTLSVAIVIFGLKLIAGIRPGKK